MNLTTPLLLLVLSACLVSSSLLPRAVWQFGKMIACAQPGVNILKFNDYGCWCGLGGSGAPVDDLDMCCYVHDKCYERSRKIPGCDNVAQLPHILEYKHSCSGQEVTCSAGNNKCQAAACECDRVAAHCFAEKEYNDENKSLDSSVHCVD